MANVKIVTDSVADLPQEIIDNLGITIVPMIVRFGNKIYRDNVDLTVDQFYEKLKTSAYFPVTSAPSPTDFSSAYDKLAQETDEILVITLTGKLSATYNVALQSRRLIKNKCRVEVLDSQTAIMAQGFVVIKAAEAAMEGASLDEVIEIAQNTIPRVDIFGTFDSLEFLRKGGRIGAAKALLGSALKINPLLTLKNGTVIPAGRTRSRAKAMDRISEFVESYESIEKLAVENTACSDEAEVLIEKISTLYDREKIYLSRMTPVIGTHTGPGLLFVAVLGEKKSVDSEAKKALPG